MAAQGSQQTAYTRSDDYSVVVDHYGNGKGTREQFEKSDPDALNDTILKLKQTHDFMTGHVVTQIQSIQRDLESAWGGESADTAVKIIGLIVEDAGSIAKNTAILQSNLDTFHTAWKQIRERAMQLGDDDDSGAKTVFNDFTKAQDDCMHSIPPELYYHTPLSDGGPSKYDNFHAGPGPGPGGMPTAGSTVPTMHPTVPTTTTTVHTPHTPHTTVPTTHPTVPTHNYPDPGTYPPPGDYPPPGGYTPPGDYSGPGYTGGIGIGSAPPPGGAHVDTGSSLAGISGGPGGGAGAFGGGGGIGDAGGIGAGIGGGTGGPVGGTGTSAAGIGGQPGGPGGVSGVGGVVGSSAGGGRGMMAPMHGAGGSDEDERERTTWLSEDDDIWGGDDQPPGVIG